MIRQLEALTKILDTTTLAAQRELLLDQAAMIHRASAESIPEPSDVADVADVRREYDAVLHAAARAAERDTADGT